MTIQPPRKTTTTLQSLTIDDKPLPCVPYVLDLGVTIDNKLKFSQHINSITTKAFQTSALIFKCFQSRNRSNLIKAYKTYVRPQLEYCSPIWCPYLQKEIKLIEKVQKKFTKRLPGLHDLSYEERMKKTGLQTLESRRLYYDLILMYKILFGHTHLSESKYFKFSSVTVTRGHKYKLDIPKSRLDLCQNWFTSRRITIWNNLPLETNFSTLDSFKQSVQQINLSSYL